jgi:hypothetical protein
MDGERQCYSLILGRTRSLTRAASIGWGMTEYGRHGRAVLPRSGRARLSARAKGRRYPGKQPRDASIT